MSSKNSPRFQWSVSILDVQPDDCILEIGCGHGIAAAFIASKLVEGKFTGIDRSLAMIEKAQKRNSLYIEKGIVQFHVTDISTAALQQSAYNKIFAINVNIFWLKPSEELQIFRRILHNDGLLHLFYEPPTEEKVQIITSQLLKNLRSAGFTVVDTIVEDRETVPLLGVIARK
jgi:protein-L-isoaspartate O-methyltransferase